MNFSSCIVIILRFCLILLHPNLKTWINLDGFFQVEYEVWMPQVICINCFNVTLDMKSFVTKSLETQRMLHDNLIKCTETPKPSTNSLVDVSYKTIVKCIEDDNSENNMGNYKEIRWKTIDDLINLKPNIMKKQVSENTNELHDEHTNIFNGELRLTNTNNNAAFIGASITDTNNTFNSISKSAKQTDHLKAIDFSLDETFNCNIPLELNSQPDGLTSKEDSDFSKISNYTINANNDILSKQTDCASEKTSFPEKIKISVNSDKVSITPEIEFSKLKDKNSEGNFDKIGSEIHDKVIQMIGCSDEQGNKSLFKTTDFADPKTKDEISTKGSDQETVTIVGISNDEQVSDCPINIDLGSLLEKSGDQRHIIPVSDAISIICDGKSEQNSYKKDSNVKYETKVQKKSSLNKKSEWICIECNKHFINACQLRKHQKSHSEDRPFVCKDCGKAFKYQRNLNEHSRLHSIAEYICSFCGLKFKQRSK